MNNVQYMYIFIINYTIIFSKSKKYLKRKQTEQLIVHAKSLCNLKVALDVWLIHKAL